jgi:two-component system phosphate regulon sensor histidine kinase PhoR
LKIIKDQKQLAEVKNDLISNITHEFKTPISTIAVAIESIRDFKGIDDKNRTKNYLNISSEQLGKLNTMVEKLLETATLDSDQLELHKAPQDIVALLNDAVQEMRMRATDETIKFESSEEIIMTTMDGFHIENAINNILDNALKYGGTQIEVSIYSKNNQVIIDIIDNGNSLSKNTKDKIFEKFYRVPKGNTHDVKGFGIGLYYSKKIIENHNGTLQLMLQPHQTIFKITLPND